MHFGYNVGENEPFYCKLNFNCIHVSMLLNTSSVMEPGVIGYFGSFNIIHPHPGDPAMVDQTTTSVQLAFAPSHGPPILIQSHLEAFYIASVRFLIVLLLPIPVMPLKALPSDCPAKPLQPNSMGRYLALQPCLRQLITRSSYLAHFLSWASSRGSSH